MDSEAVQHLLSLVNEYNDIGQKINQLTQTINNVVTNNNIKIHLTNARNVLVVAQSELMSIIKNIEDENQRQFMR